VARAWPAHAIGRPQVGSSIVFRGCSKICLGEPEQAIAEPTHERAEKVQQRDADTFKCDGRTRCSQMTSCAEATFFIRNCPDTKMDGDHDGVPCESQWCS
jgi:hypothetical protein